MRFIALPAVRRLERLATAECNPKQMLFTLRQELVELTFITANLSSSFLSILPLYKREASLQIPAGHLLSLSNCRQPQLWALGSVLWECLSVDATHMVCVVGVRQEGISALDLEEGGAGRRECVGCPLVDICPALY